MATIPATIYYSSRFADLRYKKLGKTGFTTSVCGFGCYRVDNSVPEHHKALELAIENGINLIETSSNYSFGGSEELVGNVIRQLLSTEKIIRDDVIIVTKGGYLQGENLDKAKTKEKDGKPYKDVIKCSSDLWHCIHPDFLKTQLNNSLEKLRLDKIDIYLLHNPEYFLTYSDISSLEKKLDEYYGRIKLAFEYLESEVKKGKISFYGISSNTFAEPGDKNNFTSLERVYNIAGEISGKNHFAVIQFPMNLIEQGGILNKNQVNNTKTVLEFAKEKDIGVLINRPLNAISENKIIRLADFEIIKNKSKKEIMDLISKLAGYEKELIDRYVNKMNENFSKKKNLLDALSLGKILDENYDKFDSPNHFRDIKGYNLIPKANFAVIEISKFFKDDDDELSDLLNNYAVTVNITLDSIESDLAREWNEQNKKRHTELNNFLPDDKKEYNLAHKSILLLNSLNEISCTLVGMRKTNYVHDILKVIRFDINENVAKYWESAKND
ncbi:putative aldo-keto reductase [bacterium BMS3Abin03]|nr:putative aldo-keto reductase [bacterium BMS3Abin03]